MSRDDMDEDDDDVDMTSNPNLAADSDDGFLAPPPSTQTSSRAMPWVEKYRPKGISDVSSQAETAKTLQNAVKTGNLPHLLFYGPPGTGKTSMALALCRNLWGPALFKQRVLELNASDERGISIVRNKVKHFAHLAISGKSDGTYPCPPFKLIILDEADTMTPDAQAALRRVIEAHSRITRFCLICNYVTRIIEPLASRCAKFRFKALDGVSMISRLRTIASSEGAVFDDGVLDTVIKLSEGDMRRAVTMLQCAFNLVGGKKNRVVTVGDVEEMSGNAPVGVLTMLVGALKKNNFKAMEEAVSDLMCEGFPALQVLKTLSKMIVECDEVEGEESGLSELSKAQVAIKIADCNKRLIDGADEFLQLMDVCSLCVRCFAVPRK